MKTKITSLVGILAGTLLSVSTIQAQSLQWAKPFTGNGSSVAELTLDASGNIYAIGGFFGVTDFDPGPGVTTLTPTAGNDMFVSKSDPSGNFVWVKQIPGLSGAEVKLDATGNIYISGSFGGAYDVDPGPGTFSITSAGLQDAFVLKLDVSGNFVWAKSWGSTGTDVANSIALDASANVYATGSYSGTVDFDPGAGTFNMSTTGTAETYILKLDAAGNFVWAKGIAKSNAQGIAVDAAGIYITGSFKGITDFDPGATTFTLASDPNSSDIFVSKLDLSGNFTWAKTMGAVVLDDIGMAIAVDASGNVISTGRYAGQVDFDPGAGTYTRTTVGAQDIYVQKLDASGNFLWASTWGGNGSDDGWDVAVDPSGNIYSGGYVAGVCDFDPSPASYTLSASGGSLPDAFVSKLDANGNFLWAIEYGANSYDYANGITADAAGNAYVAAYYIGTVDVDPSAAIFNLASPNSSTGNGGIIKYGAGVPTGITKNKGLNSVSVYPNPFKEQLIFDLDNNGKETTVMIYNSIGQIIRTEKSTSGKIIIQRENFSTGVYFYNALQNGNVIASGKLLAE